MAEHADVSGGRHRRVGGRPRALMQLLRAHARRQRHGLRRHPAPVARPREQRCTRMLQASTRMPVTQVTEATLDRAQPRLCDPADQAPVDERRLPARAPRSSARTAATSPIDLFFRTLGEAHRERAVAHRAVGHRLRRRAGHHAHQGARRRDARADARRRRVRRHAARGHRDRPGRFVLPVGRDAGAAGRAVAQRAGASSCRQAPTTSRVEAPATPAAATRPRRRCATSCALLRARTGHDFRHYKRATVLRRIERRMQVNGAAEPAGLPRLPAGAPDEAQALLQDLLISVTNFFRDREAFEALERAGHAGAVRRPSAPASRCASGWPAAPPARRPTRWPCCCASTPSDCRRAAELQIFATDIDEQALAIARAGVYPESIAADVSPSGCATSSTASRRLPRPQASCARRCCSPPTTCCATRRSRGST